jgi:hypothetical protein
MSIAGMHQQGDNFWGNLATTKTEVRAAGRLREQQMLVFSGSLQGDAWYIIGSYLENKED